MHSSLRLELLDVGTDKKCLPWGEELPPRLRQMHSHWICRHVLQGLLCAQENCSYSGTACPPSVLFVDGDMFLKVLSYLVLGGLSPSLSLGSLSFVGGDVFLKALSHLVPGGLSPSLSLSGNKLMNILKVLVLYGTVHSALPLHCPQIHIYVTRWTTLMLASLFQIESYYVQHNLCA